MGAVINDPVLLPRCYEIRAVLSGPVLCAGFKCEPRDSSQAVDAIQHLSGENIEEAMALLKGYRCSDRRLS